MRPQELLPSTSRTADDGSEVDSLDARERELKRQISQLQDLVGRMPEREQPIELEDTRAKLDTPEIDPLTAREREIQRQIAQLQDFVQHGPDRERQAEEERMSTLPPPSEIQDRMREKKFMDQLSRGDLKNEMRNQTKSGLLLMLLVLATLSIGWWIYQALQ